MQTGVGGSADDTEDGPARGPCAPPPMGRNRPGPPAIDPNPGAGPEIDPGPFPRDDGWGAVYRLAQTAVRRFPFLGRLARAYVWPTPLERAGHGRLFRILGVPLFGRLVPTGGAAIRRLTGARMAPYTLAGSSLRAARAFFYRACIFEALHLAPLLVLGGLSAMRWAQGRPDLAVENTLLNLGINVYPMLHHRHTRVRILRLLDRDARRRAIGGAAPLSPRG